MSSSSTASARCATRSGEIGNPEVATVKRSGVLHEGGTPFPFAPQPGRSGTMPARRSDMPAIDGSPAMPPNVGAHALLPYDDAVLSYST
jgi:hypothetical protein